MRITEGRCRGHLDKIIFATEDNAWDYISVRFPDERKEPYPCPAIDCYHYHIRDKHERNRAGRRRSRLKKIKREQHEA